MTSHPDRGFAPLFVLQLNEGFQRPPQQPSSGEFQRNLLTRIADRTGSAQTRLDSRPHHTQIAAIEGDDIARTGPESLDAAGRPTARQRQWQLQQARTANLQRALPKR